MSNSLYLANQKLIDNLVWSSNRDSGIINMTQFTGVGLQFIWSSLTGTIDGSVNVYVSNDSTNWDELTTTATTISTENGNQCVAVSDIFFSYMKVIATKNNITGGNISLIATFK